MNGGDKLLARRTLFESCVSTIETGRLDCGHETHAQSGDTWTGLKIDRVTVKLAAALQAKVNAASELAITGSDEEGGQRAQCPDKSNRLSDSVKIYCKPTTREPSIYRNCIYISAACVQTILFVNLTLCC